MFGYTFQWKQVFARLPQMLDGALVTMQIAVLSMVIGIVLAGSLDDGSRGLAAINQAGGLTMVVTPSKSLRDMPGNAITYDGPIDVIGRIQMIARAVESTISGGQNLAG